MQILDYFTLIAYLAGTLAVGLVFAARVKSSSDMFVAGGQAPWWASGLSAFMTMFSANTFVVWGGIAYRLGFVAVAINLMYGVAAILVGMFVAGKWKRLGVATAAEFIQLRFGPGTLHFYTWSMLAVRVIGTAGALYALAKILIPLMPMSEGNPLRDATTGNLSLTYAICILGGIVVLYTMAGGLWAVLMTDVLQFIILNTAVLFVIPLALRRTDGIGGFIESAPDGFLNITSDDYTFVFLAGWCAIHFFMIGAEWAFVQRFLCVPSEKDARKSTYLFGILYLVSPILWLLPPMLYRTIDGTVDHEQAYILACSSVLPAGMVGLMVAAMFSATASMVSSQLNVFSGVMTKDIYGSLARQEPSEKQLLVVGRMFTVLIGTLLVGIALLIPTLGGAEKVIVGITEMMVTALLAPTIWGLFSRRITARAAWITGIVGLLVGVLVRVGLSETGWFSHVDAVRPLIQWLKENASLVKTITGVLLPVTILAMMEWTASKEAPGSRIPDGRCSTATDPPATTTNRLPAIAIGVSMILCGLLLLGLSFVTDGERNMMRLFAVGMASIGGVILFCNQQTISPTTSSN